MVIRTQVLKKWTANTQGNNISIVVRDTIEPAATLTFGEDTPGLYISDNVPKHDLLAETGDREADSLRWFLSRPVRIYDGTWSLSTGIDQTLEPWSFTTGFFSDAKVQQKIANFRNIRATMCINVMVTGTPFHVGLLQVGYLPDASSVNTPSWSSIGAFGSTELKLTKVSQLRYRALMSPSKSDSAIFKVPFISNLPWLDLFSTSTFAGLGYLYIQSFGPLTSVSAGALTDPTIQVFAWLEDVEMLIPIATSMSMSNRGAKGKRAKDHKQPKKPTGAKDAEVKEATTGVISAPASAVASVASRLTDVPFIGKFAEATATGASAVADIAKLFGFSRPADLSAASPVVQDPMRGMATGIGGIPLNNLALDPSNAVTLSKMAGGDPEERDTLAISSIAQTESYLTYFEWEATDAADTELWWANVNPGMAITQIGSLSNYTYSHLTSIALASWPFQYWTGTIVYRFVIQASAFHRGKLRFYWQPVSTTSASGAFNTTWQEIVDLERARDIEVHVGYGQILLYNNVERSKAMFWQHAGAGIKASASNTFNGLLHVDVVNALQSPVGTTGVRVNVFVRAGSDFKVAAPTFDLSKNTLACLATMDRGETESMVRDIVDTGVTGDPTTPAETDLLGGNAFSDIGDTEVYMGEYISSFRLMMKRYAMATVLAVSGSNPSNYPFAVWDMPVLPIPTGAYSVGYFTATQRWTGPVLAAGTYGSTTPLSVFLLAIASHIGFRGAIRWRYLYVGGGNPDAVTQLNGALAVVRRPRATPTLPYGSGSYLSPTVNSASAKLPGYGDDAFDFGTAGVAVSTLAAGGTLDISIPYYVRARYVQTRYIVRNDTTERERSYDKLRMSSIVAQSDPIVACWYSIGEDFEVVGRIHAPALMWVDEFALVP